MSDVSSDSRVIGPARKDLDVLVRVPGSKSVTNRALLLAGLERSA
jgi:5-enolpyruvylshikimate-3-phosphate synthase